MPNLFTILLGIHGYGMSPEAETAWCRVYLMLGLMGGFLIGGAVFGN